MDVSVIIPIYNVQEYLLECLESVRANTEGILAEVILVDDGSTDTSATIAQQYARQHPEFKYHRTKNGGSSAARNYGITCAKGKYLFFVDADDVLVENTLPVMLRAARHNRAQITTCEVGRLHPDQSVTTSLLQLMAFSTAPNNVTNAHEHPQLVYDCTVSNKLINRRFFLKCNTPFPNGRLYEDYRVMVPLYCMAHRVAVVRTLGYLWRKRNSEALSNSQRQTDLQNALDKVWVIDQLFSFFDAANVEESVRRQIELKIIRFDFNGYISALEVMDDTLAMQFVEAMAGAVERHVRQETIAQTPLKTRQMARYLLERNVTGLIAWNAYVRAEYDSVGVCEEGGRLAFAESSDLLTVEDQSAMQDAQSAIPRSYIDDIQYERDTLVITGHLYTPRVSISNPEEQSIHAHLANDLYGTSVPLESSSCICAHLTAAKGTVVSAGNGTSTTYNYDGTGFTITIDFPQLDKHRRLEGNNTVILEYENWIKHDYRILRGVGKKTVRKCRKVRYKGERYTMSIYWDERKSLILSMERVPNSERLRKSLSKTKRQAVTWARKRLPIPKH